jgi:hypothetical protein
VGRLILDRYHFAGRAVNGGFVFDTSRDVIDGWGK